MMHILGHILGNGMLVADGSDVGPVTYSIAVYEQDDGDRVRSAEGTLFDLPEIARGETGWRKVELRLQHGDMVEITLGSASLGDPHAPISIKGALPGFA
ncbi:MAG: hypothetical protein DI556_09910 [Rhodovulum sulfidophilum]|uniref:Uncharacterized protein n=1 Tax=Rhodovulum sulfidophilum TaxID=35806 RepID=A0A2W5N8G6_RHOSU|nr:MAG: hypothetical protein DI556_09910 [Rhodovulum sulfidophilum]